MGQGDSKAEGARPDEASPLSPKTANGNGNGNGASGDSHPSSVILPWALECMASIVLIICVIFNDVNLLVNGPYTLSVGIIGVLFSAAAMLLIKFQPDVWDKKVADAPTASMPTIIVGYLFAAFGFVWWAIAAGVITFQGPYTVASNGYFAAWAAFISSCLAIGYDPKMTLKLGPVVELFICAIVLMLALIPTFKPYVNEVPGQLVYGIVVAVLTILWCLFALLVEASTADEGIKVLTRAPLVYVFFVCLWLAAAIALTFQTPFIVVGNGYFSSVRCPPPALPSLALPSSSPPLPSSAVGWPHRLCRVPLDVHDRGLLADGLGQREQQTHRARHHRR